MVTLTWQSIITAGAVLGALGGMVALFVKAVRWFDHQKEQDEDRARLQIKHDKDIEDIRTEMSLHNQENKEEQTILTYGILACLKGLKEKGCNGPVTEAIKMIEKHLNQKAHE